MKGAAMEPPRPEQGLPSTVGRYEVIARLGAGGMAEILLGRTSGPSGFSREVVIKRILPHLASDPDFAGMFLDEARLAALIRHPNVIDVYDLVSEGGELYLIMEYLEGETAAAVLKRLKADGRSLPPALVAHV